MGSIVSFITLLISLAILTTARLSGNFLMIIIFKTLCSILFLTVAYFAHKECLKSKSSTYYKLMMTALIFSWFGDVFLLFQEVSLCFILGVFSFSCAHISFTVAFFQFGKIERLNIVISALLCVFSYSFLAQPSWFDFGSLKPAIFIYGMLLCFMAGKSFSVLKFWNQNKYFAN